MKPSILIVGSGPVGLALAAELSRYGISVRLIEKATQRNDKSKALVLWSRTLELIDRMGCTASFIDAGFKVSAVNIVTDQKQIARITLDGVATPHPYALMLPQNETERLMEAYVNTFGVHVERGVELVRFETAPDNITSVLRHADGREEQIETAWLVGCDGAHSTVRHQLGMEFTGDTLQSQWILADLHLEGVRSPGEVSIIWHADGVLAIFPITKDRYRVIADIGIAVEGKLIPNPTLPEVQAVLDRRGQGGVQASKPIWLAAFRINERKVAHYRSGRIFLAGDAAHIHSPAGGQGMNTGIQDACNLAWKLALVCRGTCAAEPLLESYSIERSAVGDQVLEDAGRLTALAIMSGKVKQSLRNHIASLVLGLSHVRETAANTVTEISIGYANSPLNAQHTHLSADPAAGQRAPIRDHEKVVGAGETPRFALFAEPCDDTERLIARYSKLLDPYVRAPFHEKGLWLVRPDGYTALAAKHGDFNAVATYLDRLQP